MHHQDLTRLQWLTVFDLLWDIRLLLRTQRRAHECEYLHKHWSFMCEKIDMHTKLQQIRIDYTNYFLLYSLTVAKWHIRFFCCGLQKLHDDKRGKYYHFLYSPLKTKIEEGNEITKWLHTEQQLFSAPWSAFVSFQVSLFNLCFSGHIINSSFS